MSLSGVLKIFVSPILLSSSVTPLVLITKNSLTEKGKLDSIKTNISLEELQADKSCRVFWKEEREKELYVCRNKTDSSKPIAWYYAQDVTEANQPSAERIVGLRHQDTNIHSQLSIKLLNGLQDSSINYPNWITNWKNNYLEVEKDCTLNPSSPFNDDTITHFYCKLQDKDEPLQIILDSNVHSPAVKN